MLTVWIAIAASYLLGAIPFGYLIARARGIDIFQAGSGNIGATNVGRVLGRRFGILVFLLDWLKGAVPTALAAWLIPEPAWAALACGFAAFLGHVLPITLRFRGGKGVATGTGVVSVLLPLPTLGAALVWITAMAAFRTVSLASILAALTLVGMQLLGSPAPFAPEHQPRTLFAILATIVVLVRHRGNVVRLLQGREPQVRDSRFLGGLARVLHLLALALWCGGGLFFSLIAAPSLFRSYESLAPHPPAWLPLPAELAREQGTRLAGVGIGPLFPPYFALQALCGIVALLTSLGWLRALPSRLARWRSGLIALALALVALGWPLVGIVEGYRFARYASDPAIALPARSAFGAWHAVSLQLNLFVLLLATIALGLAAFLPELPIPSRAARSSEESYGAPAPELPPIL